MDSALTALQRELLEAFFRIDDQFFLTGGAALAGFHLGHRTTEDLDLFTSADALEHGESVLRRVTDEIGGSLEPLRTSLDAQRWLVRRDDDGVVVDLVRDRAPQLEDPKQTMGRIRIDSPREILANKLCALLSRAEIRDLVDVMALERAGFDLDQGMRDAATKDGGLTPAQLGYVLSQVEIGPDARVPGATVDELREYQQNFIDRLARMGFPDEQ